MKPFSLFINPQTGVLRGGWRLAVFIILVTLPGAIGSLIVSSQPSSTPQPPSVNIGTVIFYCLLIGWTIFISWLCLRLIEQLRRLVDAGNTVVVVEHDMSLVAAADWVIDIGPGSGDEGGQLVAAGPPAKLAAAKGSRTAGYLARFV